MNNFIWILFGSIAVMSWLWGTMIFVRNQRGVVRIHAEKIQGELISATHGESQYGKLVFVKKAIGIIWGVNMARLLLSILFWTMVQKDLFLWWGLWRCIC